MVVSERIEPTFSNPALSDETLAEAIPVHVAQHSATDMLVLQTRPHGVAHTPMKGGLGNLTDRYLETYRSLAGEPPA